MKIADVALNKVSLDSIADRKKLQKQISLNRISDNKSIAGDSFESEKNSKADIVKVKEIQNNFQKNNAGLNGLNQLQERIKEFENEPETVGPKNYDQLSQELKNIVSTTKFQGENIISYLSTNIKDDKSLYTFKANLSNEVESIQSRISDERKNIASFLVKSENLEVASSFSSEKTLRNIVTVMDRDNISKIYKGISNTTSLLDIEK